MEYILHIFKFTPWAWFKESITTAIDSKNRKHENFHRFKVVDRPTRQIQNLNDR